MKQKAFEIAQRKGYHEDAAKIAWEKVKENCGAEPTAAMLADYDRAAYLAIGVPRPLAVAWGEAFTKDAAPVKGRKFKVGRTYTAAEYAALYEVDPENLPLCDAIYAATDGKPWVVHTDKFHVAESARFIAWHMDEEIAPPTVDVDGVPVAPVMPGEERQKAAKEHYADPFDPVGYLDVNRGSKRTGASFAGYSDEALSAMRFLFERDLRTEGNLSLRGLATECRGKTPAEILAASPTTLAAWNKMPPANRPAAKRAKRNPDPPVPFGEPAAPMATRDGLEIAAGAPSAGTVPTVHVLTGGAKKARAATEELKKHLATAVRNGALRVTDDYAMPAGGFVSEIVAGRAAEATVLIAMVCSDSLADDEFCQTIASSGRTVVPVIVEPCMWEWNPTLKGKVSLDASNMMAAAQGIVRVATAARAPSSPAWLDTAPFPFSDPDAGAFYAECIRAYPRAAAAEMACKFSGVPTGMINFNGGADAVWFSALSVAAGAAKTRALLDYVLRDPGVSGLFKAWR